MPARFGVGTAPITFMSLLDFETALGRLVRAPNAKAPFHALHLDHSEIARLEVIRASAGFRFTAGVQRSWCVGRSERAAALTLSILPEGVRRQLLDEWTEAGGGTSSFFASEADALLEFIASRLPDPSHELTACRFEQATLRAGEGATGFVAPDPKVLLASDCILRRGRFAGMATFYGQPDQVIRALSLQGLLPPLSSSEAIPVLFGPGLEGLWRLASSQEAALWNLLISPLSLGILHDHGYNRDDLAQMLQEGLLEA